MNRWPVVLSALLIGASQSSGQSGQNGVQAARLIVEVRGETGEANDPQFGAGIILASDSSRLYIATAAHVLRPQTETVHNLRVDFWPDTAQTVQARILNIGDSIDVALIAVERHDVPPRVRPVFDRLGNVRAVAPGARVYAIGCPNAKCWEVTPVAQEVTGVDAQNIIFASSTIAAGSSGGGLFNEWGEVVALVAERIPPLAKAIPINVVIRQLRYWRHPVDLRFSAIPRRGYRYGVELAWLSAQGSPSARLPAGRVTLVGPLVSVLTWHLGGLRLAPTNVSLNAGVAGLGLAFRSSRFAVETFGDVGAGQATARNDAGGYYINARYVPFWQRSTESSVGVGIGGNVDVTVLPHLMLVGSVGHWAFPVPSAVAHLPAVVLGAGIRIGLSD